MSNTETKYELKFARLFDKEFDKLDKSLKDEAWKKLERLKYNPNIGKHLNYLNLWELHIRMFRIFYIINNNEVKILLLSIKHKDDCDKYVRGLTIEQIKQALSDVS